ncbi:MAG: pilus assembly protein PilM, partial [Candidatus Woesebacteria bacterium]|nr:pilus assembly protein PilM [Candidatus Woesebacteria bacterium]
VTDEIKKAIHFFQSEEKEEAPTTIIISGGSSLTPELVSYLTEVLGLETVSGNPFNKVAVDPETSKSLAPYISIYGTAVGLAMLEG